MNKWFTQIALCLLLTPSAILQTQAQVRLTEVAPTNTGQIQDEDSDRPDWIEIRNGGWLVGLAVRS